MPTSHVTPNAGDPANRLVPHDESAEVDLWGLGGVQVTSADAAQVYLDQHLIVPGCRRRSALEADAAIAPQHHRCHVGRFIGHRGSSSCAPRNQRRPSLCSWSWISWRRRSAARRLAALAWTECDPSTRSWTCGLAAPTT